MDMQYNVPLCPNHRVRPKPQKAREQLAALQVEYDDDGDERSRVCGRCACVIVSRANFPPLSLL